MIIRTTSIDSRTDAFPSSWARHFANLFILFAMMLALPGLAAAAPQGTVISYQGQLFDNGIPAGGSYDFELRLFDDAAGTQLVAGPLAIPSTLVVGGYFLLDVDFGSAWDGTLLFLEIQVRPAGGPTYTVLSPLQPIYSVPTALYAANAETLDGLDSADFLSVGSTVMGGVDFQETFFTNTQSVIDISFDHGVGSIGGRGLNIVGGLLEAKGTMTAFRAETAVDDIGHPQAGRSLAWGANSRGFDASGTFEGLAGLAWAESLNNFGGTTTSRLLGGRFLGSSEDATTLSLDGDGTYWIGGVLAEVAGTIDGDAGAGVVAGVIGLDHSAGTATSWAGYFDGDVHASGQVGIGTTNLASHLLALQQGGGTAIADAWTTHSSRRFKSDIAPLEGALEALMKLRGVTWRSKATGEEDLGLVAEEVGAVFPQVVAWEENGSDARGLDYSRLVAVLIEAVKSQQEQIGALADKFCSVAPDAHSRR